MIFCEVITSISVIVYKNTTLGLKGKYVLFNLTTGQIKSKLLIVIVTSIQDSNHKFGNKLLW